MSEPSKQTYNSYLIFLMGQLISIIGSSVVFFAVIWWITIETESAIVISIFIHIKCGILVGYNRIHEKGKDLIGNYQMINYLYRQPLWQSTFYNNPCIM